MGKTTKEYKIPYLAAVYRQINDMIEVKSKGSKLMNHSLEEGLSNEEIIRKTLRRILPRRYGIGKGKVTNTEGDMSKQCDVIIYDALSCPNLFVDDHMNQILPLEGVYAVIEVKTRLTASKIEESFDQIYSVKSLSNEIIDVSTNDLIQIIPPLAHVIAFRDDRSLETIYDNYVTRNTKYKRTFSSLSYSKKSPGYADHTGQHFLVEGIVVVNKGIVHYMYDGLPCIYPGGVDSLGSFIVGLFGHLQEMELPLCSLSKYYGSTTILYDQETKTKNGFVVMKPSIKNLTLEKLKEIMRRRKKMLRKESE